MKYLIISDIHSNLQALQKVLELEENNVDQIICLGDVVGYNANPVECVKIIRSHPKVRHVVQGNHDEYSADVSTMSRSLSGQASIGIMYSDSQLSDEDKQWLKGLPLEKVVDDSEAAMRRRGKNVDRKY